MEVVAEFEECPDCKVDAWLMKSVMKPAITMGTVGDDVIPNSRTILISNLDARRPPIIGGRVASARVYYDICAKCGVERPVRIEKGYITMPRPGQAPEFA